MTVSSRTLNYSFALIDFNSPIWSQDEHDNWTQLDAMLGSIQDNLSLSQVSGTANAVVLTNSTPAVAYTAGMQLLFLAAAANTGTVTVNVDGLGSRDVYANGDALAANAVQLGDAVRLLYDANNNRFIMLSPDRSNKTFIGTTTFSGTVNGLTKSFVGLANVDNTSDENKPVSTDQADAIAAAVNPKADSSMFAFGTYNPTVAPVSNIDTVSAGTAMYIKLGNIVVVSGLLTLDQTAGAPSNSIFRMSLPIPSTFTQSQQLAGTMGSSGVTQVGAITADTVANAARFENISQSTTATQNSFTFMYRILP